MRCFSKHSLAFMVGVSLVAVVATTGVSAQIGQQSLEVQAAQQAGYARVGFRLPRSVAYTLTHTGNKLRLVIDGNYAPDLLRIRNADLRQIGNPVVTKTGTQTIIVFDVLPGVSPSDFYSGDFLIVDVYGGISGARLPAARPGVNSGITTALNQQPVEQQTEQSPAPAAPSSSEPESNADKETTGVEAVEAGEGTNEPEDAKPDGADSPENNPAITSSSAAADVNSEDDPEPIVEQPKPKPEAQVQQPNSAAMDIDVPKRLPKSDLFIVNLDPPYSPDKTVSVSVAEADNGVSLTFDWPEQVASAVFERGGVLWMVFDQPYDFDPTGMLEADKLLSRRIMSLERRPNEDALILRMHIRPNQNAVVERSENNWMVYLKDTPAKPRFPLKPERRTEEQGQQVYIAATDIGRKIEVDDPDVGDQMIVIPLHRQGVGLAEGFSFTSAELLESAQGVAITPLTDFVDVERFNDGIIIRTTGNSILSSSRLSRATGIGDDVNTGFSRLIDFDNWRIGEAWEYRKNKARLMYELSVIPMSDDRNSVRWKLARYYLAHGRAAEALGILDVMLLEDPLLVKNTEYLAVRGVANYKQGRLQNAYTDLTSRELEAEQDAELWLTLVTEKLGRYAEALEHYRRGRDVMGTYDQYDRAEIQLAVIRSGIETGNLELAQRELSLLNGLDLTRTQVEESVYQSARIAEIQGQYNQAYAQYDDLANSSERWISARARYSRVKFALKNGDINVDEAINQLEHLRYAWRGDRFEALLLDDLASLYISTNKFEEGLESLRQGVSYYPETAKEKNMLLRMGEVFRYLFLENGADQMSPISAISLFYKFRDLTPLGAEGDLMIRRLADRLVSVDLLDRAAELLEYQVQVRTEGAARAQIAASLAKIYILDDKPQKALEIMRASREPRLPEDILQNRNHVEARALIEMSRYEEAEVLIEQDRSTEADILRADIFWGSKDWGRFTSTIRRLMGDGWRRNETLTALQRLNLIRLTIAMTFTEDRAGLIEMRRRYGRQMRTGDFANAFELLTNDQELTGRELGQIANQIASVEKLQSFMRDYRSDFSGR